MAVAHGNDGSIDSGANAVAEVQKWTYGEEDVAPAEKTSMGDTAATPLASGCKRGKISIECLLDEADTTGQQTLTVGSEVTLHLYTQGEAASDLDYTGSAVVRTMERAVDKAQLNAFSATLEGVLTRTEIS